ncbi:unnamed protein product [Ectocarpus sp. CCAP 1310/34]|nr:unnamed protein product [Ectocarpus sp. CCAP 1310/34]
MSDPTGGDNAAEDQQQGRWLGAVRSWIRGAEGEAPAEGDAPAPASSPALSADEIRRRRLERMGGSNMDQPQLRKQSPSPPPPGAKDSKPTATPVSTKPGATAGKEPTIGAATTAAAAPAPAPVVASTPGATGGLTEGGGLKAGGSGASGGVTAVAPSAPGAFVGGKGKITPEQRLHNSLRVVLRVRERDRMLLGTMMRM